MIGMSITWSTRVLVCIFLLANCAQSIPQSQVIELNDKFEQAKNDGLWFVEFYAPWCAHCKRLMPTWESVGHALVDKQSPVRVAKLDCTRFPGTASALGIKGYPTIIFFRNGKEIVYDGERDKESMVQFALKSSGPVIGVIDSVSDLSQLRRTSKDPFFVFVDGAADKDGAELFNDFNSIAEQLFSSVRFYKSPRNAFPKAISLPESPAVLVFKDNSNFIYTVENDQSLEDWIYSERWSMMPLVTSSNIREIGRMRLLVLAVINMVERRNESTQVGKFHTLMKKVAEDIRADDHLSSVYQFGWLDGTEIARNIILGTVIQPYLLVFNVSSYEFFVSNDSPNVLTEKAFLSFLERVAAGDVPPQGGRSITQRFKRIAYEVITNVIEMFRVQPLLSLCLFGVPLAFLSLITYCICSSDFSIDREEIYPDEEESDTDVEDHEKEE